MQTFPRIWGKRGGGKQFPPKHHFPTRHFTLFFSANASNSLTFPTIIFCHKIFFCELCLFLWGKPVGPFCLSVGGHFRILGMWRGGEGGGERPFRKWEREIGRAGEGGLLVTPNLAQKSAEYGAFPDNNECDFDFRTQKAKLECVLPMRTFKKSLEINSQTFSDTCVFSVLV